MTEHISLNNNPQPMFSCRYQGCAEEVSYPADHLRMHPEGGVVCEGCWYEEGTNLLDGVSFGELPSFRPAPPSSVEGTPENE